MNRTEEAEQRAEAEAAARHQAEERAEVEAAARRQEKERADEEAAARRQAEDQMKAMKAEIARLRQDRS